MWFKFSYKFIDLLFNITSHDISHKLCVCGDIHNFLEHGSRKNVILLQGLGRWFLWFILGIIISVKLFPVGVYEFALDITKCYFSPNQPIRDTNHIFNKTVCGNIPYSKVTISIIEFFRNIS